MTSCEATQPELDIKDFFFKVFLALDETVNNFKKNIHKGISTKHFTFFTAIIFCWLLIEHPQFAGSYFEAFRCHSVITGAKQHVSSPNYCQIVGAFHQQPHL